MRIRIKVRHIAQRKARVLGGRCIRLNGARPREFAASAAKVNDRLLAVHGIERTSFSKRRDEREQPDCAPRFDYIQLGQPPVMISAPHATGNG